MQICSDGIRCGCAGESRYPGAVRATNAEVFDAYHLKSLDGGLADGSAGLYAKAATARRCGEGKRQFCLMNTKNVELTNGTKLDAIVIPSFNTGVRPQPKLC